MLAQRFYRTNVFRSISRGSGAEFVKLTNAERYYFQRFILYQINLFFLGIKRPLRIQRVLHRSQQTLKIYTRY